MGCLIKSVISLQKGKEKKEKKKEKKKERKKKRLYLRKLEQDVFFETNRAYMERN